MAAPGNYTGPLCPLAGTGYPKPEDGSKRAVDLSDYPNWYLRNKGSKGVNISLGQEPKGDENHGEASVNDYYLASGEWVVLCVGPSGRDWLHILYEDGADLALAPLLTSTG